MAEAPELRALELPAAVTPAWCAQAAGALDAATRAGAAALKAVLPQDVVCALLERCQQLVHAEPTLLEVRREGGGAGPCCRPVRPLALRGSQPVATCVCKGKDTAPGQRCVLPPALLHPLLLRCCPPRAALAFAGGAARGRAGGGCGRHARPVP